MIYSPVGMQFQDRWNDLCTTETFSLTHLEDSTVTFHDHVLLSCSISEYISRRTENGTRNKNENKIRDACKARRNFALFFSKRRESSLLLPFGGDSSRRIGRNSRYISESRNETCGKSVGYLAGGQSTRHAHWKIQYNGRVDKNPMARVIDDPSLERPRYAKGLRRPSQSTLQHVSTVFRCVGLPLSLSLCRREGLPRVSLPAILSLGYNVYTASQVFAVFPSIISSNIVQNSSPSEHDLFRKKFRSL